jgi:hypothetical protein
VFRRKKWRYLILDEAHMIKNWRSQRWQTLLRFNSKRRLLITGTPLQVRCSQHVVWSPASSCFCCCCCGYSCSLLLLRLPHGAAGAHVSHLCICNAPVCLPMPVAKFITHPCLTLY